MLDKCSSFPLRINETILSDWQPLEVRLTTYSRSVVWHVNLNNHNDSKKN